ncbi:MAG TPA: site-specific DNA-methyltransferase [Terriglobales bacterium]|nr:site-specific DNA-methyltransferase [Terriglobales bacterium]
MRTVAIPAVSTTKDLNFGDFIPSALRDIGDLQTAIPRIAKDQPLLDSIRKSVERIPTKHVLVHGDARKIDRDLTGAIHLVITSPPYWTLKKYRDTSGQLGHISDYDEFLTELDRVWQKCFELLVPGGRLVCVVGDICLSRRKNDGRHTVVPLHAAIQEHCRRIGFDNLAPIIWQKIANASYEVENGRGGFLGKPYEPNAVIKNDVEYILMQRKPGGYRTPSGEVRILSMISGEEHKKWFQQVWNGLPGASTKDHPAPYPIELAERLIRMFSFVGDTVLDPFMGTGTTALAASKCGRNSVNFEIDQEYLDLAAKRLESELSTLFSDPVVITDQDRN